MSTLRKLSKVSFILFLITFISGMVSADELLREDIAEELGVSVNIGTRFETLYEYQPTAADRERPDDEYYRLITKVSYAHGGGDVNLWKIEFVEGYSVSKHLIHIYLDRDNNILTGRQHRRSDGSFADWQGVDAMITLDNQTDEWILRRREYTPSGDSFELQDNLPIFVVDGNAVYCRYDMPKNKVGAQFVFRGRVVSQKPGKTVNATPWLNVSAKVYSD